MSPRIVVCDNYAPILRLISAVLRNEGHEVHTGSDGLQGLALARETCPDLVISDVDMPELDGIAFFLALEQDPKLVGTPFIFMSSDDQLERIPVLPYTMFLSKPFDIEVLKRVVRSILTPQRRKN